MLVVEDSPEVAFALREFFSCQGFLVDCVSTFDEACATVGSRQFEAVIADCRLGGSGNQEGLELLRLLRTSQPSACCVLLTAYASPELEAEAVRSGASGVFMKPAPLPQLARALELAMSEGRSTRGGERA